MARTDFQLSADNVYALAEAIKQYPSSAGPIIDGILHNEGGKWINDAIIQILPVSGRKPWKGKKKAAKYAQPFRQENGPQSVTIRTKYDYHYLYFPDDGTNTKFHAGEQYFMSRGAWAVSQKIIDECIDALISFEL